MKKSILALVALVALSTTAYAQDGGSRSLSVYVCGNTGTLTQANGYEKGDELRTFEGNWTEFGLVYEQGFENGLGFDVSVIAAGKVDGSWSDESKDKDGSDQRWKYEGYDIDTLPYAKVGISYGIGGFSTYLSLETTLLTAFGVDYSVDFDSAGSLSVGSEVCFFLAPTDYVYSEKTGYNSDASEYDTKALDSAKGVGVLDFFQVYLGYSVGFAEKWGFSTKAGFRFGDDSSAFMFADSFNVRWDNTLSYQATDDLSFYGRVRYQANDIVKKGAEGDDGWYKIDGTDHRVSLQAGLTYSFDL